MSEFHDLDAEQAVISALMLDSSVTLAVSAILSPEAFHYERHGKIFGAIVSVHRRSETVDPITVSAELLRVGQLEAVGGKDYISELLDMVPTAANVEYHARIVAHHAARRSVIASIESALRSFNDPEADLRAVAAELQDRLLPLAADVGRTGYRPVSEIVWEVMEAFERRQAAANVGELIGIPTGWREVDAYTCGFRPGEFIILGGGPKSGKTSAVLNIVLHNVLAGRGAAFVSAEMTGTQLVERLLNNMAVVHTQATTSGQITPDDWARLSEAAKALYLAQNFFVDDEAFPTLDDVIARALHLKAKHPEVAMIVVDYLQLVSKRMDSRRGDEELNAISKGLKGLAKRAGVPVFAPCQVNYKEVDARKNPKPTLRDLQGASGMAQTADFVGLVYRPGLTDPEPSKSAIIELDFVACRRTDRFKTTLRWDGRHMRVDDFPPSMGGGY